MRLHSTTAILSVLLACPLPGLGRGFSDASRAGQADESTDQRARVTRHLDMTFSMPAYGSLAQWEARASELRQQILVSAGLWPMPTRTPLQPQIFGRLERRDYSIEKVYFESYPGLYVTGNLYRPAGIGPHPAVLSPHGHWSYGRLENTESCSVPARCISLARQGYVVFSYDMVGYNDSRQVDHRFRGDEEELWGFGSLGLHLWNSLRALDFLESLPDVDPKRLAATGASGGGTQTFLLAAVDHRVRAAAPVNMVSAHMQGGDTCENAPNLRVDTNNMEIAALMAPRPLLLVSATGDWTKNTLEVEFPAIRAIYRLFGADNDVYAARFTADHNYNRESRAEVYRWFRRAVLSLAGEPPEETGVRVEQPSDLLVFHGRELPAGAKSEKEIVRAFIAQAEEAIEKARPADHATWEEFRRRFRPALRFSLMADLPEFAEVHAVSGHPRAAASPRTIEGSLTRTRKGDRVPFTHWLPAEPASRHVLLIHPAGAAALSEDGRPAGLAAALVTRGIGVFAADVFNTGRAAISRPEIPRFFTTYNRTDDANRVQDILTSLAYLRVKYPAGTVSVAGLGRAGLWCLLARGLDVGDSAYVVDAGRFDPSLPQSFLERLNVPGLLRAGDLRTAAVLNIQGMLRIHNTSSKFPTGWIRSVYSALGRAEKLQILEDSAGEEDLLNWLAAPR